MLYIYSMICKKYINDDLVKDLILKYQNEEISFSVIEEHIYQYVEATCMKFATRVYGKENRNINKMELKNNLYDKVIDSLQKAFKKQYKESKVKLITYIHTCVKNLYINFVLKMTSKYALKRSCGKNILEKFHTNKYNPDREKGIPLLINHGIDKDFLYLIIGLLIGAPISKDKIIEVFLKNGIQENKITSLIIIHNRVLKTNYHSLKLKSFTQIKEILDNILKSHPIYIYLPKIYSILINRAYRKIVKTYWDING